MPTFKHVIPCDEPEELLRSLPKRLKKNGKVVGKKLIVEVKRWPHSDAEVFIAWSSLNGISTAWADGSKL